MKRAGRDSAVAREPVGPRPPRPLPLSRTKKLLFALVAVILGLGVIEGSLALIGVRPPLQAEDPYVGFAAHIPLFVETPAAEGTPRMVTANNKLTLFNRQSFPRRKAAGTVRIFSLGGSTTYGHPYDDATSFTGWLRELLRDLAPGRNWEVINAGGISYASYRVVRLLQELLAYEPDLFLIYCGQNEFLEQRTYADVRDLPEVVRSTGAILNRFRTAALVRSLTGRRQTPPRDGATVLPGEVVTLLDDTVGPSAYRRDDVLRDQVLRHYRFNLNRMIDLASAAGAGVLLITPASNLRDCAPFKSEHGAGLTDAELRRWQALYDEARQALVQGQDDRALAALDQAAALDARHALVHYARGQILERLGRFTAAKEAFLRARDEDVCPLRAPGTLAAIVAEVAANRQVPWYDFAALQEARSAHGIPGAAVFLDHVHPTIESHRLLALELLKIMEREGWVEPAWDAARIQLVTERVQAGVDGERQSVALMNLSKVLGWAGRLREAHRLAVAAAAFETTRADVPYQAGLCAQLLGDTAEAIRYYRRAVALDPTAAEPHGNLGVALEDQGAWHEACQHLEAAIRYGDPVTSARNRTNLARVREKLQQQNTRP
jgi:tetratricopeptide (TPR) repeat protein